jgi:hypothetical protein
MIDGSAINLPGRNAHITLTLQPNIRFDELESILHR